MLYILYSYFFGMFFSPLEQFEIFGQLTLIYFLNTVTIHLLFFFILGFFFLHFINSVKPVYNFFSFIFFCFFQLSFFCYSILQSSLQNFFYVRQFAGVFYGVFMFVLFANLLGLVPYAFTLTSQLILTFGISFILFFAVNVLALFRHGLNYFSLFLPSGSPFFMSFLLVPIELISYVARVFSLSIRLFANMMAGHCLLKIIAGFAWTMLLTGGIISFLAVVPITVVFLVTILEIVVAFLQAYVFCLLLSIYIRDGLYLH